MLMAFHTLIININIINIMVVRDTCRRCRWRSTPLLLILISSLLWHYTTPVVDVDGVPHPVHLHRRDHDVARHAQEHLSASFNFFFLAITLCSYAQYYKYHRNVPLWNYLLFEHYVA